MLTNARTPTPLPVELPVDQRPGPLTRFVLKWPEPAFILSQSGICEEANEAGRTFLRRTRDTLVARPVTAWLTPESGIKAAEWIFGLLQGRPVQEIVRLATGDGSVREAALTGMSHPDTAEIAVFLRPVEPETSASLESHRVLTAMAPAAVLLDEEYRVMWANAASTAMLRLNADAAGPEVDRAASSLLRLQDDAPLDEALDQARREGQADVAVEAKRGDGERFSAELQIRSLSTPPGSLAQGVAAYVVTLRDVTAEREQNEHAARARRLASVGTLLAGAAHELNNPLASLRNFLHVLGKNEERPDDEAAMLKLMLREVERLARIVADLRTMVREDKDVSVQRRPVDVNELLRHIISSRGYRLNTLNIAVTPHFGVTGEVWADHSQLEQVLLNLVVNAEQALAGHNGARSLAIRTSETASSVRIDIEDNGPGIPDHLRERVFDPFWTSKSPGDGTGLGLAIVHQIVVAHGGDIRIRQSSLGGARFEVTVPLVNKDYARTGTVQPRSMSEPSKPLRVLVVDDEEVLRASLSAVLSHEGHQVTEAYDGHAAIHQIKRADDDGRPFDVILSDLRMAGLGGDQLLERLRERGDGMESRLIFLTGDTASSGATRLLRDARVPVLFKPFDPDEVLSLVAQRVADAKPHASRTPASPDSSSQAGPPPPGPTGLETPSVQASGVAVS